MGVDARSGRITDVPGVTVGHYTDAENATGCTVVLCDPPSTAAVDVRGASPGSSDTEMLHPLAADRPVNGVLLTGGSVFGLAAAGGVVRYLNERGVGSVFGGVKVPLCPAAVIFDLGLASRRVQPTADDGYAACVATGIDVDEGSVGAGAGATVGVLRGLRRRIKGGLGTRSVDLGDGLVVGALVVINPVGGIVDPYTGEIVAGPRKRGPSRGFEDSERILIDGPPAPRDQQPNTVIGVVATSARLPRRDAGRLAGAGQDAVALAVRPAHPASDGDTIFSLATGTFEGPADEDRLRAAATRATVGAILSAVESATGLGGVPSAGEYLAGG
jgi:L-aminopeptidase/D-esterase-like protein